MIIVWRYVLRKLTISSRPLESACNWLIFFQVTESHDRHIRSNIYRNIGSVDCFQLIQNRICTSCTDFISTNRCYAKKIDPAGCICLCQNIHTVCIVTKVTHITVKNYFVIFCIRYNTVILQCCGCRGRCHNASQHCCCKCH